MYKLKRLSVSLLPNRLLLLQSLVLLLCFVMIAHSQATVVYRFLDRSLFIANGEPGATTSYTISLTYNTAAPTSDVGSLDFLFCTDPIPSEILGPDNPFDHHPCVAPPGLDASNAVLSSQTGLADFSIRSKTTNEIVLTRLPSTLGSDLPSTYTFDNIVNPNVTTSSYAIRLSSYASTDASGSIINLGSVLTQVNNGIGLETQVPPQLIFCLAATVQLNCNGTDGVHYIDLGEVDPTKVQKTTSQMGVGTNASNGFVITVNGTTMEAGSNIIQPLTVPTLSAPGNSQFGINLVDNSSPDVGADPDGPFTNAVPAPDYDTPNLFKYVDGDTVASAPNVSLIRRFTVSYLINTPPTLRPGVYSTTLTFICTGRF